MTAAAAVGLGTPLAAAPAGIAAALPTDPVHDTRPGIYVVTLRERPAAAYDGGLPAYRSTAGGPGRRFDRTRSEVLAYQHHLRQGQERLLSRLGDPPVLYRMTTAVNGFTARLTGEQVKRLRGTDGVRLVERSTRQHLETVDSPGFLGLPGVWASHGGPRRAGEHTVIGLVDSGIWPENPSFAALPQRRGGQSEPLDGFHGACQRGEQWDPTDCNDKLVSARYFVSGFGAERTAESEFLSPRDGYGHGSHSAATAAGNDKVAVTIEGQRFGNAAGMAPAARIAAYKACWTAPDPDDDGCTTADTVAAIDQAVADGVDVIAYPVSGPSDTVADSVERAFLNAAAAGVFVAASAGNDGRGEAGVAHLSPWVTTVGASTHRPRRGSVRLGNGEVQVGAMISEESVRRAPLVLGSEAAAGVDTDPARICENGALDSAQVEDRIVVCERGGTARVDKSAAVARAGGVGMVLANTRPGTRDADFHSVPTVHLGAAAAAAVERYVRHARVRDRQPTAVLAPVRSTTTPVPALASFSARGLPARRAADLLKPDLTAPGVGVIAAVAPPSDAGRLWDVRSGTSVSTAHIAGLAAFVVGVRPHWSPGRIKSAMLTTATDLAGGGPLSRGAGQVVPGRILQPGLVYDPSLRDWYAFAAGRSRARALNLPSIALGNHTGRSRVTRAVTNVSGRRDTFSASVTGLDGITVDVQPARITMAPNATRRFTVTFRTQAAARLGSYTDGSLTWTGTATRTQARIPLAVRPQPSAAAGGVTGSGTSGELRVAGRSGTARRIQLRSTGVVGAAPELVALAPGIFDPSAPRVDADTAATTLTVPPGTTAARFEVDAAERGDDLDLFAYRDGALVAQATGGSGDEQITLVDPEPGTYRIYLSASSAADELVATGRFYTWVVPSEPARRLQLRPRQVSAPVGDRFGYRVSWRGLDDTLRWFGLVQHGASDERTWVRID